MKKTKDILPSPPRVKTKETKKKKKEQRPPEEDMDEDEKNHNKGKTMDEIHDEIREEVEEVASFNIYNYHFFIYREEASIYLSQG